MIAQPIEPCADVCSFADRWGISDELARRLMVMASRLPWTLQIISGHRSCQQQEALDSLPCCSSGQRPCSTHTTTPATGADVWPVPTPVSAVKAAMLEAAYFADLRMGGGSPLDSEGFPTDWNHLDMGAAM